MKYIVIDSHEGKKFNPYSNNMNNFIRLKSPGCPYCRMMDDEWKKLEKKDELNKINDLNIIDLHVDALKDIDRPHCMRGLRNKGVPFIFILNKKGEIEKEYNGTRESEDMKEFVLKHLKSKSLDNSKSLNNKSLNNKSLNNSNLEKRINSLRNLLEDKLSVKSVPSKLHINMYKHSKNNKSLTKSKRKSRSKTRSKSRSKSRSRSRSKTRSRSRSKTRSRPRSKTRSRPRSKSRSKSRSKTRSRSRSKVRKTPYPINVSLNDNVITGRI